MNQVAQNPQYLRGTIRRALDELADDARQYLQLVKQLEQTPVTSDTYRDVELEVDLAVTVLMTHASSLHDLFEALDDALPDEDD